MATVTDRLSNVSLECCPALDLIEQYGSVATGLVMHVDPPYLGTARSGRNYLVEMSSAAEHRQLADVLHAARATVILVRLRQPSLRRALRRVAADQLRRHDQRRRRRHARPPHRGPVSQPPPRPADSVRSPRLTTPAPTAAPAPHRRPCPRRSPPTSSPPTDRDAPRHAAPETAPARPSIPQRTADGVAAYHPLLPVKPRARGLHMARADPLTERVVATVPEHRHLVECVGPELQRPGEPSMPCVAVVVTYHLGCQGYVESPSRQSRNAAQVGQQPAGARRDPWSWCR